MNELATTKERHQLSVMGPEGHAEIVWNVHDYDSITHAKKMFDDLTKKGYQAFNVLRMDDRANKGGKITKFDPSLEEVILVPPVSGG